MKKLLPAILFIFLGISVTNLFSQKITEESIAQVELNNRGEVHFKFKISSPQDVLTLTQIISIDNFKNDTIYAYANPTEFDKFLEYNIPFEVILRDYAMKTTVSTTVAGMANWDMYPSYDVYVQMMNQFETDYPTLCRIVNIGNSTDGASNTCSKDF